MNTIVKLSSNQSGAFSSTRNLLDFDLPSGRQYDLRNSYVNLVGSMLQVDADPATGAGVYNYQFQWTQGGAAHNLPLPNVALVKNARMTSDRVPILEDIRRVDILRTQINQYAKNLDEDAGVGYRKLFQNLSQGNTKVGLGLELQRQGELKSSVRDVNIQIPLKDIFELGQTDNLPCDKLGTARVHLEMNFDKLSVVQLQGTGSRGGGGYEFGKTYYTEFETSTVGGGDLGTTEPFKTAMSFADIKSSPFFVTQKLKFSGSKRTGGTPTGAVSIDTVITSITRITTPGVDQGKLSIVVATALTNNGATEDVIDIICDGIDVGSLALTILEAELVLEEKGTIEKMDELVYSTYTSEEDSASGNTSFSRLYSLEPEAYNVLLALPNKADIICANAGGIRVEDYRLMNDNVFLTDRAVQPEQPLYYDRTSMWFLNQGLPLRNLEDAYQHTVGQYDDRLTATENVVFIGNPLPITAQRKQLQVTIDGDSASGGVDKLILYKSVVRNIKL